MRPWCAATRTTAAVIPLQGNQTLAGGSPPSTHCWRRFAPPADLVIDTSSLSVPALRASIENAFGGETVAQTSVTVESFGFKYGLPMDADMVMDVRFPPNLHWVDEFAPPDRPVSRGPATMCCPSPARRNSPQTTISC